MKEKKKKEIFSFLKNIPQRCDYYPQWLPKIAWYYVAKLKFILR